MQTARSFAGMDSRCLVSRSDSECARGVISRDGTRLLLAERKYSGSQFYWLLQKDQVARIEFNRLRVRNQILRVIRRHDLIVLCSNQQSRGLDSRASESMRQSAQ